MEMKYIVTEDENGKEEFFMFPKSVDHDCFAEVAGQIKNKSWGNWERVYRFPVSAGFTDGTKCYGRSESLDLDHRAEDILILHGK